ncbi:MAG: DUF262 domain-containing protein [Nitrospirales bacterium]|nr:DUF262 domain-containing protein [Nitrospirales bacterium]
MKIKTEQWPLHKLVELRDVINPAPQFQRGEVWKEGRKQLLIDSILRGFDFPKIYLSKNKTIHQFQYDVADGQQRLRAIWEFFNDAYPLSKNAVKTLADEKLANLKYSELPTNLQRRLQRFKTTVAVITNSSQEELRTLFARLQMGVVLTPAELRNAILSAVGSVIDTAANTHSFFKYSDIPEKRFKKQDFLAHALALCHYKNSEDLKAALLTRFYEEQSIQYDKNLLSKTYDILDCLAQINQRAQKRIHNKWGFVDLFWLLYQKHGSIKSIDVEGFAEEYVTFEDNRIAHTKTPEHFLEQPKKKYLYDYIQAFNTSGAGSGQIAIRNKVIHKVFIKFLKS